jgi:hypothetical protein
MNDTTDAMHVDGNALGGLLIEVFGREMTDARGCCASCGMVNPLGAMRVYRSRVTSCACPICGNVTIVTVVIREHTRVHLGASAASNLSPSRANRPPAPAWPFLRALSAAEGAITAKPRADVRCSALRLSMAAFGQVPTAPFPFAPPHFLLRDNWLRR